MCLNDYRPVVLKYFKGIIKVYIYSFLTRDFDPL